MDTSTKILFFGFLLPLIIFCGYIVYADDKADKEASSSLVTNLSTHTNTKFSKVVSVGHDSNYWKTGHDFPPTYLLEDGTIIHEIELEPNQQKFAPFVKVGDTIEYTKVIDCRSLAGAFEIMEAHIENR